MNQRTLFLLRIVLTIYSTVIFLAAPWILWQVVHIPAWIIMLLVAAAVLNLAIGLLYLYLYFKYWRPHGPAGKSTPNDLA